MAVMTKQNGVWILSTTATGANTQNVLLATENTFTDGNISVKFTTPPAETPTLTVVDNTNEVSVGETATNNFFPVTNAITAKTTYNKAGWIEQAGLGNATDSSVQVGKIAQSVMSLGATTLTNGATISPAMTATQTITIGAGYETARTLIINPISSGDPAAATVSATKQAVAPTLSNTASAQNNKVQITVAPTTATTGIDKYYIALTANAPATNFAVADVSKIINTVGYLSSTDQITVNANAINTSANSTLFYAPIDSASATVSIVQAANKPTAGTSTSQLTGKTRLTGTPATSASGINKYYIPFVVTAPATTATAANISKTIARNGYIDDASLITVNARTTTATQTYYMPIATGTFKSVSSSTTATSSNITFTIEDSAPVSNPYIAITGSGTVGIQQAGYFEQNDSFSSNAITKYVSLPKASVTATSNVISVTEGYVSSAGLELILEEGTLSAGTSQKVGYAVETTEVPASGYLYINAGYFPNTQISLASLIPDSTSYTNATSAQMLNGYEAYDTDGNMMVGTITTYTGIYTIS